MILNVVRGLICLIFLLLYSYSFGICFFKGILKLDYQGVAANVVIGWLLINFSNWLFAFPCQLFSVNWYKYFIIFAILNISLIFVIILWLYRNFNKKNAYNKNFSYKILKHIQRYWLVYLLAIVFTFLSICNMQPYTLNNYSDDHYIIKIAHMIGSDSIMKESFANGFYFKTIGKFGNALMQHQRIFNTYELLYGSIATIFHINVVYFCRVVMTAFNYLFFFYSVYVLCSFFISNDETQFGILPFILFIIPAGYLAKGMNDFSVRIWENWRFQTAMYMGSSIVRLTLFPVIIFYFEKLKNQNIIKRFLLLIPIILAFLSFQTTTISYIILLTFVHIINVILGKAFSIFTNKDLNCIVKKLLIIGLNILVLFAFTLLLKSILTNISISFLKNYLNKLSFIIKEYHKYYNNVFKFDFFARFALVPLLYLLFEDNSKNLKKLLFVIILYFVFLIKKFDYLISIISYESFCTGRLLTSVQMLTIIFYGIAIVKLVSHFNLHKFVNLGLTVLLFICSFSTLTVRREQIVKYSSSGDSITKNWYSLKPLLSNKYMTANVFLKVDNYFNKLPTKKYVMYSEDYFYIDGTKYENRGFLLNSKNIINDQYWYDLASKKSLSSSTNKMISRLNEANWFLERYVTSNTKYKFTYKGIKQYVDKANVQYLFTTRKNIKNQLLKEKCKIVLNGNDKYWLILLK